MCRAAARRSTSAAILAQLNGFTISGFDDGDTLDLTSVSYVSAGASANLLTGNELEVKVGGATYDFQLNTSQNFAGEFFHVTDDGHGHTDDHGRDVAVLLPGHADHDRSRRDCRRGACDRRQGRHHVGQGPADQMDRTAQLFRPLCDRAKAHPAGLHPGRRARSTICRSAISGSRRSTRCICRAC